MKKSKSDSNETSTKRGPKPDSIKIEGDWEAAVDKALAKKRPKDGWPPPEKKRASPKRAAREAAKRR
jgi:hypothetical protein